MAEARLFRGLRYGAVPADLGDLICPPYDVLSADEARGYAASSPYNAIHLHMSSCDDATDATADEDRYARAAAAFARWQEEGVLVRDQQPALYTLEQQFRRPNGVLQTRRGFIAQLRLESFASGIVRRHERTNAGPRHDRLSLLRATKANMSPIFILYPDQHHSVWQALAKAEKPQAPVVVHDREGVVHTLQPAVGPRAAEAAALLADRSVIIADGHHRYEMALAYRDERRAAGSHEADYCMAYFCGTDAPGLAIFPAHRLLRSIEVPPLAEVRARLAARFAVIAEIADGLTDPTSVLRLLSDNAQDAVFGLVLPRDNMTLVVKLRHAGPVAELAAAEGLPPAVAALPVTILHHLLLRDVFGVRPEASEGLIDYSPRPAEAFEQLRAGRYVLGAFFNAPTADDVRRVTDAGAIMPQKATYFFPKLPTGLVFCSLDG